MIPERNFIKDSLNWIKSAISPSTDNFLSQKFTDKSMNLATQLAVPSPEKLFNDASLHIWTA